MLPLAEVYMSTPTGVRIYAPAGGSWQPLDWLRVVTALGSAGFTGNHSRRNFSVGIFPE